MTPRRAAKRDSPFGPRLIVACVVALFIAFAGVVVLRLVVASTHPPPPQPTTNAADAEYQKALAKYSQIPRASCPASLDPNLRRQFYREGQCPPKRSTK